MASKQTKEIFARFGAIVTSLVITSVGLLHVLSGETNYSNYWGGRVFAPFAICIGLLLIYLVIFRWETLKDPSKPQKNNNKNNTAFYSLLLGMLIGLVGGAFTFYNLDTTLKSNPNPYGWWYPATFLSTVLGGILGVIIYGIIKNKKKSA